MTRGEALALLESHAGADNLQRHCLATEANAREFARTLCRDQDLRGIAGLQCDPDFAQTQDSPEMHSRPTAEIPTPYTLSQEIIDAILRRNAEFLDLERESILDCAPSCAETVVGLLRCRRGASRQEDGERHLEIRSGWGEK